jgi:hypothetical protein
MEDKRSIKNVLESQGDVHEKVVNQTNPGCIRPPFWMFYICIES